MKRAFSALVVSLTLVLPATGAQASADALPAFADAAAARAFDYCAWWRSGRASGSTLSALRAVLDADGSTSSRSDAAIAVIADAGARVASAASSERVCRTELEKGGALFEKTLARQRRQFKIQTSEGDPALTEIKDRIGEAWASDQAARLSYLALRTPAESGRAFWAYRLATAHAMQVDGVSTSMMKGLVAAHGWIDATRFGVATAKRAWLLVQHADHDTAFQARVLTLMEPLLETGGVDPSQFAYLWDRVAVNAGRKQRYGTQPDWHCKADRTLDLMPLEDPENVDARRAALGMGPVAHDLAEMARNSCR